MMPQAQRGENNHDKQQRQPKPQPLLRLPSSKPVVSLAFLTESETSSSTTTPSTTASSIEAGGQNSEANADNDLDSDGNHQAHENVQAAISDVKYDSDDSDDDDDDDMTFRCAQTVPQHQHFNQSTNTQPATNDNIVSSPLRTSTNISSFRSIPLLLACHQDGTLQLWNVQQQKRITFANMNIERAAQGLCVRRTSTSHQFLYQTRDGVVSIHSASDGQYTTIRTYHTHARTFCQASPCCNDPQLFALPHSNEHAAAIVDLRSQPPVAILEHDKRYGMLTSLAMSHKNEHIVACGMENGTVVYHDRRRQRSECSISETPVLALDLQYPHCVAATADTVAILKRDQCTFRTSAAGSSICRFRGRLFAVGGWDHRVRIFNCANRGLLMALLKDPTAITPASTASQSVTALDWSPDARETGLLATASTNANDILIW
eukprot:CAMPEP_0198124112 /NCGR_PEP_ID=MMETSP1442-20131203/39162_1 /TAXON_ID= /ORGANISM="Craspedostauros australis, Strain CCMP3328" /LENGTH=432 /DNA_ID=CAMNT_0043783443 /DNA_START=1 /DNA_END=1296 /DNA_ORIENTATION=+